MLTCCKCVNEIVEGSSRSGRIDCKICEKSFHLTCVGINTIVYKYISTSDNIVWFCDNCIQTGQQLTNICSKLSVMENTLKLFMEKVENQDKIIKELQSNAGKTGNITPLGGSKRKHSELVANWGNLMETPVTSGNDSAKKKTC